MKLQNLIENLIERFVSELSPQEKQQLDTVKSVDDIKSVEVINTWVDDHIECVGAKINGIDVGFWWIGKKAVAAFEYADSSPKAKQIVYTTLVSAIEDAKSEDEWL